MEAMVETPGQSISRFQIIRPATMSLRRGAATEEFPAPVEKVGRAELVERGVLAGWASAALVAKAVEAGAVRVARADLAVRVAPAALAAEVEPVVRVATSPSA